MERIEAGLRDAGRINFPEVKVTQNDGSKEIVCLLADLHIGQCFSSVLESTTLILRQSGCSNIRVGLRKLAKRHGARVVRVVSVGDQISGNIHSAIVAANQENVIEQVKIASRLIAWFCNELYKTFEEVYFYDVFGNHSRITPNKKTLSRTNVWTIWLDGRRVRCWRICRIFMTSGRRRGWIQLLENSRSVEKPTASFTEIWIRLVATESTV